MADELLIDELAIEAGTTTRSIRALQSMGLLDSPSLRGRTGVYGNHHLTRLRAIHQLQAQGFSLPSIALLYAAFERGESLADLLHLTPDQAAPTSDVDAAELYGFPEVAPVSRRRGYPKDRPFLSVVPTTVWDESQAS